nr:hypothetical protein [uncultured Rhodoferax sp.]
MLQAIKVDPTYEEWLEFIFDRPELPYGEHISLDGVSFDPSPEATVHLISQTCARAGTDLIAYSDAQVCAGLDLIFNPSLSDLSFALKEESVDVKARHDAIKTIETLYQECFSARCSENISNGAQEQFGGLNPICYMLWDVSPLTYWEDSKDRQSHYRAVVDLLENCLQIGQVACVESALHGLGHIQPYATEIVQRVIDKWARKRTREFIILESYAAQARQGRVQ